MPRVHINWTDGAYSFRQLEPNAALPLQLAAVEVDEDTYARWVAIDVLAGMLQRELHAQDERSYQQDEALKALLAYFGAWDLDDD